jgi:O-6-methylguanine DNA methyltransferase
MNAVVKNTPPANAHALDSLSGSENNQIAFSIGESDIGRVLVARSNMGVCAILIEAGAGGLRVDLSSSFAGRTLVRDDERLRGDLEKVTRFIKTSNERLDLPLDTRGTSFERRVWEVLRTVRVGAVITYAALARRIGKPDALRAVANACANNPLALAIPGHRVVRTNGALA